MAKRGAKPKPAHLRLIEGTRNVTRHGSEEDLRKAADVPAKLFGRPVCPEHFDGQALVAWERYIAPASWLDATREAAAIAFCELWQEFMFAPRAFPAAKHGQMRAYMSELGLTDERNRTLDEEEGKDEFFD